MLLSFSVGLVFAILTIAIHAGCSSCLIGALRNREAIFRTRFGGIKALVIMAVGLLIAHFAEATLWAAGYTLLVGGDKFSNFSDAEYFSTVTFSTLGYGDIVLEGHWKLLSAIQAMTGLLVFGWSTALLFSVVERVWNHKFDQD